MEKVKFTNNTEINNEKAVKVGNKVPSNGAGLAWFTSESINPRNNIVTVNVSETIPENKIKESYEAEIMYADELGILRRIDGRSEVSTDDITISNVLLDRPTVSETFDLGIINANNFGHYMYVSRYFTVLPPLFSLISLKSYQDQDTIYNLGMKVLDEYGKDYIDINTKRKKYKILLEPFKTEYNVNLPEIPYRVIVVLDSSEPINLKLIYNKIECDEKGKVSNQQLRYTETINAVKYFSEVAEESFVIDPNYYGSNKFSIKKIDEKYSNINVSNKPVSNGYQVLVPSKAIKDYRTYEVFNWRIIGKIKRTVNLEDIDYGLSSNAENPSRVRTVKAGILYSGNSSKNINAYALYRLENSPFNLTKLVFENPITTLTEKNKADYWKVNIDSVTSADLNKFDVLLWSPDSAITPFQAGLINNFVSNNFGTLILDLTFCPNANTLNSGGQLSMQSSVAANVVDIIDSSIPIDSAKNGGWTINDTIFEKDYYSVLGSRLINGVTAKTYKYFPSAVSNNVFIKAGPSSNALQGIGVILGYSKQNDTLTKGNIIATTFNLLAYCNSIYDIASPDKVVNANEGATHNGTIDSSTTLFSSVVEGPFKLLFNCINYGLYCKALSQRQFISSSGIINFVTDWSSSWVMYSDAIEEMERKDFDLVSITSSKSVYARNLTKDAASSNASLFDYFKSQLTKKMPQLERSIINTLTVDDVDFYVEITNPDVNIKDSTKVEDINSVDVDIPSSYILYKINQESEDRIAASPLYAYTEKYSRSLARIQGLGPHILMERPINSSSTRNLINMISPSMGFNSYPFKLKSYYSMYEGTDLPYNFNLTFSGKATYKVEGTYKSKVTTTVPVGEVSGTRPASNTKSAIDDYQLNLSTNSSDPSNFFPYTGDIDIHGDPRLWKEGSPKHEYVKYIQYTLALDKHYSSAIDGVYGPATAKAVLSFQKKYNTRYKDSKVDSETKWYLAFYWLVIKALSSKFFDDSKAFASPDIRKYIEAVEKMGLATDINSNKTYRKITFTGFTGPAKGTDIIFFEVPSQMVKVNGIKIVGDRQSANWRNFKATFVGWNSTFSKSIFDYPNVQELNLSAASSDINIPINNLTQQQCKYMYVALEAGTLSGYGSAEGMGISKIEITGTVDGGTTSSEEEEYTPVDVTVEVLFSEKVLGISPSSPKSLSLKTVREISRTSHYISKISFEGKTVNFNQNQLTIGSNGFENSKIIIESFSRSKNSPSLSSLAISNVVTTNAAAVPGNPVSFVNNSGVITFETSATYYGNSIAKTQPIDLSNGFRLKTLSGNLLPQSKNTINYGDGVLLICDSNGNPAGIPSYKSIRDAISATMYSNMSAQEKDVRYGYFTVYNELSNEGLRYGFYDVSEKRFLGNDINYIDLYTRAYSTSSETSPRNISNVYIAICALDADGRNGDNEFFGLNNSNTFIPSTIPLKYLVPVYSVKYKSNSSINVGEISQNISKFEAWELPVSNGSFRKKIYIQPNIEWHDWKRNYSGQELLAEYSTVDTPNVSWSKIYGHGYYDIVDEHPVIIDNKTIQVRRTPVLAWNHPTDYVSSIAGIIKPEIQIFTRETKNDPWVEINYSYIRDINCHSGVVSFKKSVVPSSSSLIKVSYTTENKNLLIRQVDGNAVPLNPFLNNDSIIFDKPLYIYLLPEVIYKYSKYTESFLSGEPLSTLGYEKIDDYTHFHSVNFTYNSAIFDKNSIDYNPFALVIALIYVTNRPNRSAVNITDIRLRGGGVTSNLENSEILTILNDNSLATNYDVLSYWDVYPPQGNTYTKGGYVIIQIPNEVKEHFISNSEIRNIISNNLTAGVVFDLQDLEGNSWS